MVEPKKRADGLVVAVLTVALLFVPLAAYVGGYFLLPKWHTVDAVVDVREFNKPWQATIYQPAGMIERMLTGRNVAVIVHIDNYPTPLPDGMDPTASP